MGAFGIDRWTPRERRAAATLALAWMGGALAGWIGLDRSLAGAATRALHPPRPSVSELADRTGPEDPRPQWYAAALALRREEEVARSGPRRIDPNTAGRAEWDRLPGVGPATAVAIVGHREAQGPFRSPSDLLAVRGIGPKTLERLAPYLEWGTIGRDDAQKNSNMSNSLPLPDLNQVDEVFLMGVPGFGPKLAETVVRERKSRGAFRDWAELSSVEGIGPVRLRALQKATRLRGTGPSGGTSP